MNEKYEIEENGIELNKLDLNLFKNYNPYLWSFAKAEWAIFGTLTWENRTRRQPTDYSEKMRQQDFSLLLKNTCRKFEIRNKNLAYYRAMEWGAGECHYHFLIAKNGIEKLSSENLAEHLQQTWKSHLIVGGMGTADVRPYDKAKELKGVKYCLKREFQDNGNEKERIDFLSPRLFKYLKNLNPQNYTLT